jgi:hypothetical protein
MLNYDNGDVAMRRGRQKMHENFPTNKFNVGECGYCLAKNREKKNTLIEEIVKLFKLSFCLFSALQMLHAILIHFFHNI